MPDQNQQGMQAVVMRIRSKLARLKPEDRVRMGFGDRIDSLDVGLVPRPTAKSASLDNLVGSGQMQPAVRDSLVGGAKKIPTPTVKERALQRLTARDIITPARRDSLLGGAPREKKPSEKKQAVQRLVRRGLLSQPQADSTMAGIKAPKEEKKPEPRSLIDAGAELAKEQDKTKKLMASRVRKDGVERTELPAGATAGQKFEQILMDSMNPANYKKTIDPASPAYKNLAKKLEAYQDSSGIVERATRILPTMDFNKMVELFPIARQAGAEYEALIKGGRMSQPEAVQHIQSKYGVDIKTLERIGHVETGK